MEKVTLYHNPKCSKSRKSLELLSSMDFDLEVREYLKNPLSKTELLSLMDQLIFDLSEFVRVKETEFQAEPFSLEDKEVIATKLEATPKLMERPIIVKDSRALIARPFERLDSFLS